MSSVPCADKIGAVSDAQAPVEEEDQPSPEAELVIERVPVWGTGEQAEQVMAPFQLCSGATTEERDE